MKQRTRLPKRAKGFTMVELLVTVAILAFGIVTIYEALFVSMDTFGYYTNYLGTQDWINEKIAEVQSRLTQTQILEPGETSGRIVRDHKTFDWSMTISPVNENQGLYKIDLTLSWKQGSKRVRSSRAAYLLPPQLKVYNEENFG
ncbi:MAG: prepilin-type N-terminal cleavage/methylation domain-containing protein [Candidatus Omnitrophica bacterium]|nr:prepilin-type N-terminal cleavage/methylation domain-containing protein [Candidatus Omnitrophota bacterium]